MNTLDVNIFDLHVDDSGVFHHEVTLADEGKRLDVFLAEKLERLSRSLISQVIREGGVWVDGRHAKPALRLSTGQRLRVEVPDLRPSPLCAQDIGLCILYEDVHLLVLDKAWGMVVHPAPGHPDGTLVNALLHHCPDLGGIGGELRPGIVHRLDKDTSGLMVVAKHQESHGRLVTLFHDRLTEKRYTALVWGEVPGGSGIMDAPIGRHPVERKRMAAHGAGSRSALSLWTVLSRYEGLTLLDVEIRTGRTHQIRVHLSHGGYPIVGDALYGARRVEDRIRDSWLKARLRKVERQMLHARYLAFRHPITGEDMAFESQLPPDMAGLLEDLAPWKREGE